MSEPRNLTLERVNRLTEAVTSMAEHHAAQGRVTARLLVQISEQLNSMDAKLGEVVAEVRNLSAEQVLLGNRVEEAFAQVLRTSALE
jgi:hypothetical protein